MSREDLDALNLQIARYKAERSGVNLGTQGPKEHEEKASLHIEGNVSKAEQLDLFAN